MTSIVFSRLNSTIHFHSVPLFRWQEVYVDRDVMQIRCTMCTLHPNVYTQWASTGHTVIRLSAPSIVISRPTCFSSSLRCCWQVGSAPFIRRRCDCLASWAPFTNIQTYLLTYLLTLRSRQKRWIIIIIINNNVTTLSRRTVSTFTNYA